MDIRGYRRDSHVKFKPHQTLKDSLQAALPDKDYFLIAESPYFPQAGRDFKLLPRQRPERSVGRATVYIPTFMPPAEPVQFYNYSPPSDTSSSLPQPPFDFTPEHWSSPSVQASPPLPVKETNIRLHLELTSSSPTQLIVLICQNLQVKQSISTLLENTAAEQSRKRESIGQLHTVNDSLVSQVQGLRSVVMKQGDEIRILKNDRPNRTTIVNRSRIQQRRRTPTPSRQRFGHPLPPSKRRR
ncbi:Hypothetical predicted protein [Mytilus galloprovincialis]|uniref:Uncharacterized protein n=1 Tax=Mytilus galloprovincialis TaxID=29158 RepID=A0A8B6HLS2_MYTGA|nr:Hypothetical predicted protein [Mytilus galloprovincialis]